MQIEAQTGQLERRCEPTAQDEAEEMDFGPARPPATASDSASESDATIEHSSRSDSTSSATAVAASATTTAVVLQPGIRRVKVYALNASSRWDDQGTGHVSYVNMRTHRRWDLLDARDHDHDPPDPNEFRIVVSSETTAADAAPEVILSHALTQGYDYQVQGVTIIQWTRQDTNTEVALSFQDTPFCVEAWRILAEQLNLIDRLPLMQATQLQQYQQQQTQDPAHAAAAQHQPSADEVIMGGLDADIVCGPGLSDDYAMSQDVQSQHETQQDELNARRLPDDHPDAPPVTIDSLDKLAYRLHSQRISRRELLEIIQIWRDKEAEFEQLLEADRAAFAIEQAAIASQPLPAAALSPTWRAAHAVTSSPPRGSTSPSRSSAVAAAAAAGSSGVTSSPPLSAAPLSNRSAASLTAFGRVSSGGSSSPTPRSPFSSLLMQVYSQLHSLFKLVKYLLLLNDVEIFEFLFSDTHIGSLIGILEYDPVWSEHPVRGLAPGQKCRDFHTHRSFIEGARFKHVLDFHDDVVTHKVHQSYKILYLKDVVLFNHLDDATSSTFTQILFVNQMSIIQRLTESAKFMSGMFTALNAYACVDRGAHEKKQQEAQRLERQQTQLIQAAEGTRGLSTGSNSSGEANTGSQTTATQPLSQPLSATSSAPTLPEADASSAQLAAGSSDNSAASATSATATAVAASGSVSPSPSASDSASFSGGAVGSSASAASPPSLHSLLLFLQELVLMAKSVQIPVRDAFYKVLDANALFEVLEAILARDEERRRAARRKKRKDAGITAEEHSDSDFDHDDPSMVAAAVAPACGPSSRGSSPSGTSSDGMLGRNWLWLICTDIISNICIHDASLFRNYLISTFRETHTAAAMQQQQRKAEGSSILSMVFRCMTSAHLSTSLAHQMSCLIRLVLDPEAMSQQDQVVFLGRVYKHPMMLRRLIHPLKQFQPTSADETPFDDPEGTLLQVTQRARQRQAKEAHMAKYHLAAYHSIELLSYCALHHNLGSSPASTPVPVEPSAATEADTDAIGEPLNYFRAFCLEHSVLPLVMQSLRRTRRNDLVCSAIRFFRICIGSKDAAYTRIICAGKLFAPIFLHFAQNGSRYNLLNSVVCEIVHFFNATSQRARPEDRVDNYNPQSVQFLRHLIVDEQYWQRYQLDRIQYVKTFQQSKQILAEAERENEQMISAAADGVSAHASRRKPADQFSFDHGLSQSTNRMDDDDEVKPVPPRISVSRTTHSILSDSDEEEEDEAAAAAASAAAAIQQQAAAAAAAAVAQAQRAAKKQRDRDRAGKDKHVSGSRSLARRQARRARQEAERLQQQQQQQQQPQQSPPVPSPAQSNGVPEDDEIDDADNLNDALLNYDDSSSSSSPDSITPNTEEDEEAAVAAAATDAASAVPVRRIVFVSSEGDGAIKRQPLPHSLQPLSPPMQAHSASTAAAAARRLSASKNKRKLDEVDAMTSPPPAVPAPSSRSPVLSFVSPPPSATPSPPLSLHSPPPHGGVPHAVSAHMSPGKHNPYLHVPPSELPPTAQRSPELKPVGVPLPAASSSLPDHPAPNSPPRQLTTLDLAEDCDAAAAHEVESRSSAASTLNASGRSLSLGSMGVMLAHHSHSSSPPAVAAGSSSSPPLADGAVHLAPLSVVHVKGTLFASLAASNATANHTKLQHAAHETNSETTSPHTLDQSAKRRKTLEQTAH